MISKLISHFLWREFLVRKFGDRFFKKMASFEYLALAPAAEIGVLILTQQVTG